MRSLLIFQAMDAAGKDGAIKQVMSGVNPQGCQVFSFKHPCAAELQHEFLWRTTRDLPERGRIDIFNRSYYEEVLIARVHPEILQGGLAREVSFYSGFRETPPLRRNPHHQILPPPEMAYPKSSDEPAKRGAPLPDCLDDYVVEDNPVRVIDVFMNELDLAALGFGGMLPATTGRPAYHPATLLKIYLYGYLNRIPSSRRLEREAQRNIELMWLTGRLMPDFKTIADFRKDNGVAIRAVCRQFMVLCRRLNLFTEAIVAIDGSKFKAVNNRDKNFTPNKIQRRMKQIEASIGRYMAPMDAATGRSAWSRR
jgi:transposase